MTFHHFTSPKGPTWILSPGSLPNDIYMRDAHFPGATSVKAWLVVLGLSGMAGLGGERIMSPTIEWSEKCPELFRVKLI